MSSYSLVKVGPSQYNKDMNRKHVFTLDEYYHIYNRGVEKRIVFQNTYDYHRFMLLLYFCNSNQPVDMEKVFREGRAFADMLETEKGKSLVAIGAWCLMPNHFHILIKEISENGITEFMRKVTTGYSMYFNKKYKRTGTLFEGKFKSEHVNNEHFFKYIFSYIHLNPVKLVHGESKWKESGIKDNKKVENFLKNYSYSSFINYMDSNTKYENILAKKNFPDYFLDINEHLEDMKDWLSNVKVGPSQN